MAKFPFYTICPPRGPFVQFAPSPLNIGVLVCMSIRYSDWCTLVLNYILLNGLFCINS